METVFIGTHTATSVAFYVMQHLFICCAHVISCFVQQFRSLADQIKRVSRSGGVSSAIENMATPINHVSLRQLAADHLRANADQYAPFIGVDYPSTEFDDYCTKVEDVAGAVWGGELEVSALSSRLEMPVWVYEVDKPILKMGENFESCACAPLKITYHRHYYSLGEHYNSVDDLASS
jgi:OTU domain-containing protein 6